MYLLPIYSIQTAILIWQVVFRFGILLVLLLLCWTGLLAQAFAATDQDRYFEVSKNLDEELRKYAESLPPPLTIGEVKEYTDGFGRLHLRVDLRYAGYPIKGKQLTLHQTAAATGRMVVPGNLTLNATPYSSLASPQQMKLAIGEKLQSTAFAIDSDALRWVPHNFDWQQPDYWVLARQLDVHGTGGGHQHLRLYFNAESTEHIFTENRLCTFVPATVVTRYSGVQTMETQLMDDGVYRLFDATRGQGIHTQHISNGEFLDVNNFWNNANVLNDDVAGDVHWGMGETYDWFLEKYNRNSYDNEGLRMEAYLLDGFGNAFWNSQYVAFGEGEVGSDFDLPFTSIDVVGHEIAHGMTEYDSGLIYSGESGGLNEAFSDMVAMGVQGQVVPEQLDWKLGNDFSSEGFYFRNMANPQELNMPDTYGGDFWSSGLPVHVGSSVANYWFYLMVAGGSGTNDFGHDYAITGFGLDTAMAIAYHTWSFYLTAASDYPTAATMSIIAAGDLYGNCSEITRRVRAAWLAVGIETSQVPAISVSSNQLCDLTHPPGFRFLGEANTILWDFGDGNTSTDFSPNHLYAAVGSYTVTATGTNCEGDFSVELPNPLVIDPEASRCDTTFFEDARWGPITACSGIIAEGAGSDIMANGRLAFDIPDVDAIEFIPGENEAYFDGGIFVYADYGNGYEFVTIFDNFTNEPVQIGTSKVLLILSLFSDPNDDVEFLLSWNCLEPVLPQASFSYLGSNEGCSAAISLIDESTGFPTSWTWSANGEVVSTERTGFLTLPEPGVVYDISLAVCNAAGCDTMTWQNLYYFNLDGEDCQFIEAETYDNYSTSACLGSFTDNGGPNGPYANTSNQLEINGIDAQGYRLDFTQFDLNDRDEFIVYGYDANRTLVYYEIFTDRALAGETLLVNGASITISFLGDRSFTTGANGFVMEWTCLSAEQPVAAFTGESDICNNRLLLSDQSTGFTDSLRWYLNGELAGVGPFPVIDLPGPGSYDVSLLACNQGNCDSISIVNYLVYTEEDLEQAGCLTNTGEPLWIKAGISVFPNPTDGRLLINGLGEISADWELSVTDLVGRKVAHWSLSGVSNGATSDLELTELAAGMYLLVGSSPSTGKAFQQRIIKKSP
ncbi:MAG: M4 family metallopeptidase [Bacteroidota bacterium]